MCNENCDSCADAKLYVIILVGKCAKTALFKKNQNYPLAPLTTSLNRVSPISQY